jgi:hypothetical protein
MHSDSGITGSMKLAESFVNLPAWGFWGVVIAAAGIPIGVWAAFHAAHTKTRLYYTLTGDTSLLGGAARDIHQLEVFKSGVQLHDPYIAYLKIRVRGRNDIGEDAFPKGDPLAFKIGTP